MVSDHRDELRIRGFSLDVAHRVAEELLQRFKVSPVPGDLDGVADGALDTGRRGAVLLRHGGIEHLGDGVDF